MDISLNTSQSPAPGLLTPRSSQPATSTQGQPEIAEYPFKEADIWADEHWLDLDPVVLQDLLRILYKDLGYRDWQPGQLSAIRHAIEGKDVFVALPTGAGKSAIYQVCSKIILAHFKKRKILFVLIDCRIIPKWPTKRSYCCIHS